MRRLNREGLLRAGIAYGWQWKDDEGVVTASIKIGTHDGGLSVCYRRNGEVVEQRIATDTTPCNYGGARVWFVCPYCRRRAAILYLSKQVACRLCFRLAYLSQSEDELGRLWRKQSKIEARLQSRKRMTGETRERLLDELWCVEEARDRAFVATARRMFGPFADFS
ncbi:hypothetical protein [Paraburkholderia sp. EG304]|uniref:hypothetical protein n=1 Tax=Paraburkholderia sp. EG304 TaxID=3237015 RepID=UPI0039794139